MERPERPSRHKSNPIVKYPVRPAFSSDSESELNDDVNIQITYYQPSHHESSSVNGGVSTSSSIQQNTHSSSDTSNNNIINRRISPLRVTLSPIPVREDEHRVEQEPIRRKRTAATLAASSAAASVIFDSVDSLIGNSSSRNSPDRPLERFQHSDYLIRPRSFCIADCGNAMPPVFKLKRPNGAIDLTPSTSNRDSSSQAPASSASFSLRDSSTLPSPSEVTQSHYYNRLPSTSCLIPPPPTRHDQQSTCSNILRQFDEMCCPSPVRRRPRAYSVRFLDSGSRCENFNVGHVETVTTTPASINNSRESPRTRNNSLDDYCDLVGNFLFNYPSPTNNTEHNRSSPVARETVVPADPQAGSSSSSIINRHVSASPELIPNESAIMNDINSYLNPPESTRNVIDGGEVMEQSNDDVIVVEPERPPLPITPETYMVPSSRSPSPQPQIQSQTQHPVVAPAPVAPSSSKREKPPQRSNRCGEIPMTLQELNKTLVSLLECPVCLDHATPPIYQCCKGHIMCQSCHPRLTACPICRSRLPGDRSSAMEKVAEKLMYPCKNTLTGCNLMLNLDEKQAHEEGCGFRHYACIKTGCHWKGYKPELVVHMQSNHPDKLILGATKELHVSLLVCGNMFSNHHWIQSAHNEVFNVVFQVDVLKRLLKGCIIYIGSPDRASKFTYKFELRQPVFPYRTLSYSRVTHTDPIKPGQQLCLSTDFSLNIEMAGLYRPDDCPPNAIPVHISIVESD